MPDTKVARDYLGQWWLPGHSEEHVPGRLQLDRDGSLHLQLYGVLETRPSEVVPSWPLRVRYNRVCGVTSKGYTLLCDVTVTSVESVYSGTLDPSTGNSVREAFVNIDDVWDSEPVFTEFAVQHSSLNAWAAMQPFQKHVEADNGLYHVQLEYDRMAPILLGRCGLFDATLEADAAVPAIGLGSSECSIRQNLVVRFKSITPQTLDTGLVAVASMYRLLTLATITKTRIVSLTVRADGDARTTLPTEVLFNGLELGSDTPWERNGCVFSLADLGSAPATFLARWFETDTLTYPVTELLAMCTEMGLTYSWSRSLHGIQALEVYHRQTAPSDTKLARDTFSAAKRQVLKTISDTTVHDVFADALAHANEPSLRTRLTRLAVRAAPALDTQLSEHQRYIRLAVDTRNYYTHWDPTSAPDHAVGWDLQRLSDWAELLLRALLMLDMGFAPDRVSHLLRTSRRTQWGVLDLFPSDARNSI